MELVVEGSEVINIGAGDSAGVKVVGGGGGGGGELVVGDGRGGPPPCAGTCVNPGDAEIPVVAQYVVVLVPQVATLTAYMILLSQVQRARFLPPVIALYWVV